MGQRTVTNFTPIGDERDQDRKWRCEVLEAMGNGSLARKSQGDLSLGTTRDYFQFLEFQISDWTDSKRNSRS
jgi:hypothetical protein